MYKEYYLSKNQVKLIDEFRSGIRPLLIYGPVGCGKTTLAKYLLKDTLLSVIDSIMVRDHALVSKTIEDLLRKNITLMFQDTKHTRGLLIDDIHIFMKEDKKTFGLLGPLIGQGKHGIYRHLEIIITGLPEIAIHRSLKKYQLVPLHLSRTKSDQYKLVKRLLKSEGIKVPGDSLDSIVHTINQDYHQVNQINQDKDNFYTRDNYMKIFLSQTIKAEELVSFLGSHDMTLYLNLLDALPRICAKDHRTKMIPKLYSYAVDGDKMDLFINTKHLWELSDYSVILYMYPYQLIPKTTHQPKYNKYISKSLIITHSSKINADIISHYDSDKFYILLLNLLSHKIQLNDDILMYIRSYATNTKYTNKYLKNTINSIYHYYGIRDKGLQKTLISLV